MYTGEFRDQLSASDGVAELFSELAARIKTNSPVDALLYIDSKTYLPGDIMTKVDRMSMAVSLEARAPLLDHKLIDFVTKIPAGLKLKGEQTKHIMKQAVTGLVPDEILNRPKQGFGVPVQEWINQQLKERMVATLSDERTRQRGYVNSKYLDVLLDEHWRGRRDHSSQLWSLLMLELWHRQFVDRSANSETKRKRTDRNECLVRRDSLKPAVLQLIDSFNQGGSELQAVQLTRLLCDSSRFSVHLASLNPTGPLRAEVDKLGFSEIPSFPLTSFYDLNAVRQLKNLSGFLRQKNIQIIQTHDFYTNVFGMAAGALPERLFALLQ